MIKNLTSLRFFFALMVFFHHLDFLESSNIPLLKHAYTFIFKEGFIGVSFFFILSGFIMQHSYSKKIKEKKIGFSKFMTLRFLRIYPMHYITLIASIPLIIQFVTEYNLNDWIKIFLFNSTLTQSFYPQFNYYMSFNTPSWSLSNEMFFYACFPLLTILLSNKKILIAVLSVLFVIIFTSILYYNGTLSHWLFYIFPVTRLADFILGIFLYEIFLKIKEKSLLYWQYSLFEIGGIAVFILFFIFHNDVKIEYRFAIYYWLPTIFVILSFALEKGFLSKLLNHKYLAFLGEISFSFYLLHTLVIRYYFQSNVLISNVYLIIALIFCITLLLSACSFIFIETPINTYFKRKLIKL